MGGPQDTPRGKWHHCICVLNNRLAAGGECPGAGYQQGGEAVAVALVKGDGGGDRVVADGRQAEPLGW